MPKNTSPLLIYSTSALLWVASSAAWLSWREKTRIETPQTNISTAPTRSANPPAKSSDPELARMVAGLPGDRLESVANNFRTAARTDPASTERTFRQLSLDLATLGEHAQALDLATYLFGTEWLPDIERRILHDWVLSDTSGLRDTLLERSQSGGIDEHQLSILASLILTEYSDQLDEWSHWISQLSTRGHENLHGRLVVKTMIHSSPSRLEAVTGLVEKSTRDPYVMSHLPQFVSKTMSDEPDKALSWINSLENADQQLKAEALASVISDIAMGNPSRAEEILAGEKTMISLPAKGSGLHEQMVESYIRRMLLIDPDLAGQGLVHLRDENLRLSLAANIASQSPDIRKPQTTNPE